MLVGMPSTDSDAEFERLLDDPPVAPPSPTSPFEVGRVVMLVGWWCSLSDGGC